MNHRPQFRRIISQCQHARAALVFCVFMLGGLALAQTEGGELRMQVEDPAGLPLQCVVQLVSEGAQVRDSYRTNMSGTVEARNIPFGSYTVQVNHPGFAVYLRKVQIASRVPVYIQVKLAIQTAKTDLLVSDIATLVDPQSTGAVARIGADSLRQRKSSLPGRAVIDIVASQPGWVLESNGTLHPRGAENQVQYVVDGIPFTENRSPAFSAGVDVEDVQSVAVLTGDFPAELGRKLGGVIELTSKTTAKPGVHGDFVASAGSFNTAAVNGRISYVAGKNAFTVGGEDGTTDRYLDPPVLANFTNHGTTNGENLRYDRVVTDRDRVGFSFAHQHLGFQVPNEFGQEIAGQRQDRGTGDSFGTASYEHIVSDDALADARFMFRHVAATLGSNSFSTPVIANQDRGFSEAYGKATFSLHRGVHNIKAGGEFDYSPIQELFGYSITNPSLFDPATPLRFSFRGRGTERDVAVFVQDTLHFGDVSATAGLRYDHYALLLRRSALSPRLGVGWYSPTADLNLHASFDRVFEPPASENILLSSSAAVQALSSQVVRLPVQPSTGNYWDAGITKGVFKKLKINVEAYRRSFSNYADDDRLLNTGVSFPIAFRKAKIYGSEAKIEIPRWGRMSGFVSYSYMVGFGYTPVTGGLFLGDDAANALLNRGRFPVTQDQRNTISARGVWQVCRQLWAAFGMSYGSGLPSEINGTYSDLLQQYGRTIVDRIDLSRGRVRPVLALNASLGVDLYSEHALKIRMQADAENLSNRENVINFAGLFSGTGIAPPRSYAARLQMSF